MSDQHQARLARLTELAERAFPNHTCVEVVAVADLVCVEMLTRAGTLVQRGAFFGDRALDALEAALCILAGEPGNLTEFDRGCFESMRHNLQRSREHGGRERERAEKAEFELAELRARLRDHAERWDEWSRVPCESALTPDQLARAFAHELRVVIVDDPEVET